MESNVALQGWAMSSAIVGSFIGVLLSGGLADRYGRKPLIYTAAILFIISALGTGMVYGFGDAFFQPPDIPRSGWKVIAVSSEWIGGGEKENILDGNKDTFWHNIWMGGEPPLPHYVIIDFGKEYNVMMIELTRRLWNNDLKVVEFSTSMDNKNYVPVGKIDFGTNSPKSTMAVNVPTTKARYLKCMVTESNRPPSSAIAEVYVKGL